MEVTLQRVHKLNNLERVELAYKPNLLVSPKWECRIVFKIPDTHTTWGVWGGGVNAEDAICNAIDTYHRSQYRTNQPDQQAEGDE
jgi:hypothetical protein